MAGNLISISLGTSQANAQGVLRMLLTEVCCNVLLDLRNMICTISWGLREQLLLEKETCSAVPSQQLRASSMIFKKHSISASLKLVCVKCDMLLSVMTCSKKVKFIRIDGSTPAQTRGELVNKFQQNSDVRVAILSINAAGTGLTLTVSLLLITTCRQKHYTDQIVGAMPGWDVVFQLCKAAMNNMMQLLTTACTGA